MKNYKNIVTEALEEVKTNMWVKQVSKAYNVSEEEVRGLYEENLQIANDYINSLNEEGKRMGGVLDSALGWIFRGKKKGAAKAADAAPPTSSGSSIPSANELKASAREKTIDDLKKTDADSLAKSQPGVDPKSDALDVKGPRPAADLKAGDMRSQFAKGPATDAGVAKADASFKTTSQNIGKRKAAEKSAGANKYPEGEGLGNIKAKADTDARTSARVDAEAKAKRDVTMGDTAKKVAKGLAGAGVLGAGAVAVGSLMDRSSPSSTGGSNNLKPATVMADKPEFKFGSKKGGIVSAAELDKFKQHTGNKNVTLGQYMNARDKLTAVPGKANDPQQIMKSKNLGAADVYRPDQIKAGMAQRSGPAAPVAAGVNTPPNPQAALASKKLRKEETENSLISAFLQIQASGSSNLFEAAKKAKKDWDKDGKVESGTDEWKGSRDKAIKKSMKEESEADKAKKKSMSHELDAPSSGGKAPETTTDPDWLKKKKGSKVVQTSKNTSDVYKEEVVTEEKKLYSLHAVHDEAGSKRHLGSFNSPEEAMNHVEKLGDRFPESHEAILTNNKTGKKHFYDDNDWSPLKEGIEFSGAELAHINSIVEGNPIAPVPDDYSGAAGGVSKRDLSDETVAEGIRGMRRKDSKFKDDPKKYSNEYPKGFRQPGTMSKSEMRDHIESSVRRYLKSGGRIKKS